MRNQTCCFTGHRHIPPEVLPALSTQLETAVRGLITSGIQFFHAGGALGFDYEKKKVMRSEVLDAA